jgi:DtxR family Mn-dependent transcriptional regulator
MTEPAAMILVAVGLLALAGLLFRPGRGLIAVLQRMVWTSERERIEDSLKHLYDCEYRGDPATVQSLAGSLEISTSLITKLIARLETLGLVRSEKGSLRLTTEGRRYALRIVRVHRLWEAYLAERTGFKPVEWHSEADRREHRTSAAEIEHMVQATGNPLFDPHGDAIPTEQGEMPGRRGEPLSDLAPGLGGIIVHVEDEPAAVYSQLCAQNIRLNQRVTVLDRSAERIRVEIEGEEQVLAPIVAANVFVSPLPEGRPSMRFERLSSARLGEARRIAGLSPACQGLERKRLLDLGILPGTEVTPVLASPAGDPTAYRIRGALIALRREQADRIQIWPRTDRELAT